MKPTEPEPVLSPASIDAAGHGFGTALPADAWRREAVIVIDESARVVEWNADACLMFGFGRDQAIGRGIGTLVIPENGRDGHRARWEELRAARGGGEWTFDAITMLARGEEVPVTVRVTRIGGPAPSFVVSVRDMSGREPTEQAHRQLATIIESSEDAMATLESDGTVTSWNAAAEGLYGWTANEMLGTKMYPRLIPDERAHEPGEWLMALRRGAPIARETKRLHKNGEEIWVYVRMLPVHDDAGEVTGAVWIARDVTDRHRLEERERLDQEARQHGKALARALAEDLLTFAAQPIVDLGTGRLHHYELLLRMRGNDGELVLPGAFLPQAERSGQIVEVDSWVIRHGIDLALEAPVALNLSAAGIARGGLIREIERRLERTGVAPGRVTFEITETVAAEDIDRAAELVERLGALGCGIALDDFGTGFGTFTYLNRLPVTELKIDREFVSRVRDSPTKERVVRTMIAIARNFGMRTVAEGIEDHGTLTAVIDMGVDLGQGFLLGRPALIDEVWGNRTGPV
jgi:PAS domain S-box-containing protein